ncbi:ABC transporter permease, partial [Mucilaginibacter sp.]|uniref:ABC transporter permease n=1 Tax=Mucilaginibacter sp. TaxID=1882438 RepID=UPI002ED4D6B9
MNQTLSHISWYNLVLLGTLFAGLTLALVLGFAQRHNRDANRFLAIALGLTVSILAILPVPCLTVLGPLLYFYVRKLTQPNRRICLRDIWLLSPLLLMPFAPRWLILSSFLPYLLLIQRLIKHYYTALQPVLMDKPRYVFRRLGYEIWLLALLCVIWIFNDLAGIIIAIVLIKLAAAALMKRDEIQLVQVPLAKQEDLRDKGRWLKHRVLTGRFYEDTELTLASLAVKLSIHPHELSRIINQGLKKNFSDFINELRVKEVARKIQEPAYGRLTLLGIAWESGFNSKTTFNRVFKEIHGKTPLEYKNSFKKEVPIDKLALHPAICPVILQQKKRNFMIRNYFKIAWRSLLNNKISSFINISGLSIGMAVAMLIGLWIHDEVSYNHSYDRYDRIAQVMVHANYDGTLYTINSNPLPLAAELRSAYGNNFKQVVVSTATQQQRIVSGDKQFDESGRYMDPAVTDMLTLKMSYGSRAGLSEPNTILLSQHLSEKLFGKADPVGKIISIDKKQTVKVTGVYEDQPDNSEFKDLGFIAPFALYLSANDWARKAENNWNNQFVMIYTELNDRARFDQVSAKIRDSKLSHVSGDQAARKPIVFLQPMSRWHLYNQFKNGVNVRGDALKYVWFYGTIGLFVLLLACINFMNLSTARSERRAKEVGIRKVIGSGRSQLIAQFYTESVLLAFFGWLLGIGLVAVSLPWFNGIASKAMYIPWLNPLFWLCGLSFTLFTGFLAGSYPALYLSAFKPIKVLKGNFRVGPLAAAPRQVLVVLQFTISIALIIGTIVVYRQIHFAQDRPVGYTRDGLVSIDLAGDMQAKYEVLYNELKATGSITYMAESSSPLTSIWSTSTDFDWPGKAPDFKQEFSTIAVSSGYGKTVSWQFTSGRDFGEATASDSSGFVVNESAVKVMGLKAPLNAVIKYGGKSYRL